MADSDLTFKTSMKPRLIEEPKPRKSHSMRLPFGKGRVGYTKDPGTADIFEHTLFETRLRAVIRDEADRIIDEIDLGSGKVTNVGVLALAYDGTLAGNAKAKAPFNLFTNLEYHQWGTSETAEATTDIKLNAAAATKTKTAEQGTKAVNTVTASGTGAPKLVSTATLECGAAELKITEWGIFTQESLIETKGTGKFVNGKKSATEAEGSAAAYTASSTEEKGERLKIAVSEENSAKEAKNGWALVTSNTATVLTFPAWYTEAAGAAYTPETTAAYKMRPVMFDHRVFGVITVKESNKIEFPWELEIKSGG